MFQTCLCLCLCLSCAAPYQVLVGQPGDLVLQTGFDASLRGELKVLGQELLLTTVLLFDTLQLTAQCLHLIIMGPPLSLQLVFQ